MKISRRWAIGAVALAALLLAAVVAIRGNAVEVSVATVTRDTLSVSIAVEGRTRARDSYTVTAPVSGRLARLELKEGDTVVDGQILARLVPAPEDARTLAALRAQLENAEAHLLEAQAFVAEAGLQHTQAQREAERRRPLHELGGMSREEIERVELAAIVAGQRFEAAQATESAAQAALTGAKARLLGAESGGSTLPPEILVRAPVAGRVLIVPDESERVVLAGTTLLVLADVGGLEAVLDVLSEDAVRIAAGHKLLITRWGGTDTLLGEVRSVTMSGHTKVSTLGVEEQRVDVFADIHHAPVTLGSGYRVAGDVVVWHEPDVLVVPTSAVFRTAGEWRAFVIEDGKAQFRRIVIGQRSERLAEIVEGLQEGETVITFPSEEIEPGVRVRAQTP